MSAFDTLKKVGVPATVAAVIAAVITVTPFIFKIDERYAKASELEELIVKNEEKLSILTAEVGKLAGVTEVLVTVIGQQRQAIQHYEDQPRVVRGVAPRPVVMAPPPPPQIVEPDWSNEAEVEAYMEALAANEPAAASPSPEYAEASAEEYKEEVETLSAPTPTVESVESVDDVLSRAQETLKSSQAVLNQIQE